MSLFTLVMVISCKEKGAPKIAKEEITGTKNNKPQPARDIPASKETDLKIEGDRVIVPEFKLEVNLSDEAVKSLQKNKESIIASLFFYGDIADENSLPEDVKKQLGPNGLKLLATEIEKIDITRSNEFQITNLSFPKKLYDALSNKEIYVNINVFSGRRAFKDNILDMEFYDSKLNDIISHSRFINLNGRLLKER